MSIVERDSKGRIVANGNPNRQQRECPTCGVMFDGYGSRAYCSPGCQERIPSVWTPLDEIDWGWRRRAACAGMDPALFFPERGESTDEAKATCAGCPVREPCLDYALDAGEKFGIFGGRSERERRAIRRQRKAGREVA